MRVLAATGNPHKLDELRRVLSPMGVEVMSPAELGLQLPAVEETGSTFAENARLKAVSAFRYAGMAAVADDSGLCVDALDGRPGVYSARYMGEGTPYHEKNIALLDELRDIPAGKRTARFTCAVCLALDEDTFIECEESCEGEIGFSPSGEGGFGYDPVFYMGATSFAEISGEEKDLVSHRGKALRRLADLITVSKY